MSRDRLVSVFVVLTATAMGVVVWTLVHRHPSRPVRTTTAPLIVEVPPTTPLRDSGPKNNRRSQGSAGKGRPVVPNIDGVGRQRQSPTHLGARTAPLPSKKRQTPKTKHKHRPASPSRPSAPQTPPQPPVKQCPPVSATAPLPVTVTTPLVAVNC